MEKEIETSFRLDGFTARKARRTELEAQRAAIDEELAALAKSDRDEASAQMKILGDRVGLIVSVTEKTKKRRGRPPTSSTTEGRR